MLAVALLDRESFVFNVAVLLMFRRKREPQRVFLIFLGES
jgi:hypothetical protein